MRLPALLIVVALAFSHCKKSSTVPECIGEKIDQLKRSRSSICSNSTVKEYEFQGSRVFVIDEQTCNPDGAAGVFSADCQYLGTLGGFASTWRINGILFYENARLIRTVWHY